MKVIRIRDMIRNDCTMDLECEHCGHEQEDRSAYDDRFYINAVVPKERYCDKCKKNSAGEESKPIVTDDLQGVRFGQEQ